MKRQVGKRSSGHAEEAVPEPTETSRPSLKALLAVAALAFLPYIMLAPKPIISDAMRAVVLNPVVQELPFAEVLTHDFWGVAPDAAYATRSYRPLVTLTYALQARALGNAPQVFHVTDMLLHAGIAVLVVLLVAALLPGTRWAVAAGALFAVHPAASEAVCSIIGRADMMAAAALIGALLLHLRACTATSPWWHELGALALVAVGMFSKEYGVAFPFILGTLDLALRATGRTSIADQRRQARIFVAALLILGGYLGTRYALIGALGGVPMIGEGDQPLLDQPLDVRLGTALWLIVVSARFMVFPVAFDYFYGAGTIAIADGLLDPRALAGLLLVGVLIAWAVHAVTRRSDPVPAVAVALFLFPLAPSLNTVSIAGVLFAERFLYLPLAGFALAIGRLLTQRAVSPAATRAGRIVMTGISLIFLVLTAQRVGDWRSTEALALASLRWYPESSRSWFEVGLARGERAQTYEAKGNPEKAREEDLAAIDAFRRSLATEPRPPQVWRALALALKRTGEYAESAKAYRKAIELSQPDIGILWAGLGEAELQAGMFDEAVRSTARARELMPRDPGVAALNARALVRLGQKRMLEGNAQEAVSLARRALDSGALPPEGVWTAGEIFQRAGERDAAAEAFRNAAAGEPEVLRSRFAAAMEFDRAGRHEEAAAAFAALATAQPDHVPSLFNLGRSLVLSGRPAEAIPVLERGLALQEDARARALLVEARRQTAAR